MDRGDADAYPAGSLVNSGLKIRELLAAMAMQGMLSNAELNILGPEKPKLVAKCAIAFADALIEELNGGST